MASITVASDQKGQTKSTYSEVRGRIKRIPLLLICERGIISMMLSGLKTTFGANNHIKSWKRHRVGQDVVCLVKTPISLCFSIPVQIHYSIPYFDQYVIKLNKLFRIWGWHISWRLKQSIDNDVSPKRG